MRRGFTGRKVFPNRLLFNVAIVVIIIIIILNAFRLLERGFRPDFKQVFIFKSLKVVDEIKHLSSW